jgi:Na+-transporting methylmalonyl-CoA/oxaloacetate decarboxylase gamma subunit
MKNVMLAEPATIALFGMGFLLLLLLMLLLGATIFLIVHFSRKSRKPSPPSASPVAPATQIIPRQCPQCGAELKPDVSEGLCPACLLQRGIATEGGVPPGTPPFTPPTIPDLARLFPQLEILELIGKGGMGAVYKARQPTLDRFVALKILAPRSGGDLDFAGRFTREARALAKLNHPNIVGVYDFGIVGQASRLSPSERPCSFFEV